MEDKFLLVSLKEEKSKKLAEAISNKTSRKIIDYLTEKKESTESEISKELEIPLPTAHYNLKLLQQAKLVETKEFFWSKKGKEMKVYKLSNKLVVIAPSNDSSLLEKLKSVLPIALVGTFLGLILKLFQNRSLNSFTQEAATDSAKLIIATPEKTNFLLSLNIEWFLIGLYLAILLFLIFKKK